MRARRWPSWTEPIDRWCFRQHRNRWEFAAQWSVDVLTVAIARVLRVQPVRDEWKSTDFWDVFLYGTPLHRLVSLGRYR